MHKKPVISLIIPAYNVEKYISKALSSCIKLPNPDKGLFEEIKKAVKEIRLMKSDYEDVSLEETKNRYQGFKQDWIIYIRIN